MRVSVSPCVLLWVMLIGRQSQTGEIRSVKRTRTPSTSGAAASQGVRPPHAHEALQLPSRVRSVGIDGTQSQTPRHPKSRRAHMSSSAIRFAKSYAEPVCPSPAFSLVGGSRVATDISGVGKSFTEIARLVGELWQGVDREEKERLEGAAAQAKMRYTTLMTEYKKTSDYAAYQTYLVRLFTPRDPAVPGPCTPSPSTPLTFGR